MTGLAKRTWPLALLVALSAAVLESARMGFSGLVVELAQAEVDRWAGLKRQPPMAEVNRVAQYFSHSLAFVGDNPWALEGLGALDLARVRISRVPDEALRFARDANTRFKKALHQRPASPYLWANLALSKLYLDEVDAEFFAALRRADDLGPWEPSTQQAVLFAGLAAWGKMDAAGRKALTGVVERGSVRNAKKMFEIVKSYGRFDMVCSLKGYHVVAGPECGKSDDAAKAVARPVARGTR